ncbi:MAG: winged helix-turn-helix domain-containing protein [Acidobacteriota bacterium]
MPRFSSPSTRGQPSQDEIATLRIGDWLVDPDGLTLRSLEDGRPGDEVRRLEPKVMELLLCLGEHSPAIVPRDAIFEQVWEGKAVVDGALSRAVSVLRQALGDDPRSPRYIETVPRRGYRLVARVERTRHDPEAEAPPPSLARSAPPIRAAVPATVLATLALLAVALIASFFARRSGLEQASPSISPPRVRIAVLPLDQLDSGNGDSDLAGGLTEALIHQLSTVSALSVVSRTSAEAVRADDLTAPEIARRLRVDYLIEGSILAAGERLRITIQLIAPLRDEHVWSRTYDRTMADVLDLQSNVAIDVTARVAAELTPVEQSRLRAHGAVDGEAYRRYLLGRQGLEKRTRRGLGGALEHLEAAVALDPELALAWAALAEVHLLSELYLSVPQTQAYARTQEAVDRALVLDPELAAAYAVLGQLRLVRDWDWAGAEESYRAAIELAPSDSRAHQWLSECLSLAGRHREALDAIAIAAQLDPLSPLIHAAWGQRLNAAGRYREALDRFRTADALGAQFLWHLREVGYAHQRLGEVDAALEAFVERMRRRRINGDALDALNGAVEADGLIGYWRWQHDRLASRSRPEPMLIAEALAGQGDLEDALPWLRAAAAKRGSWFLHLSKSPAFDPLRDDSRFARLVAEAAPR